MRVATLNLWGRRGEGNVREPNLNVTPRTANFACGTFSPAALAPEPVGPLLFVNHLPNWQLTFEHERELKTVIAARTIEEIAEGREVHVVLAGDLDATPDAASVRFWRGRQSPGGYERLLPRRLGEHAPRRARPHLHGRESAGDGRELGLG